MLTLTPKERAAAYAEEFPQFPSSHFMVDDRWIGANWVTGNNYRSRSGYYGSYPPGFIGRIYSMFPDAERILHLFSGSLTAQEVVHPTAEVFRLDLNEQYQPDYVVDAEDTGLLPGMFDLVMADPVYSREDAEHYGRPLCNKRRVLEEVHRILMPNGCMVWLDQSIPMHSHRNWYWWGVATMYRSTNHRIRSAMFF